MVGFRCSKCKSKMGYIRLKTNKWICRSCGHESKVIDAKQMAMNFVGLSKSENESQ